MRQNTVFLVFSTIIISIPSPVSMPFYHIDITLNPWLGISSDIHPLNMSVSDIL